MFHLAQAAIIDTGLRGAEPWRGHGGFYTFLVRWGGAGVHDAVVLLVGFAGRSRGKGEMWRWGFWELGRGGLVGCDFWGRRERYRQ